MTTATRNKRQTRHFTPDPCKLSSQEFHEAVTLFNSHYQGICFIKSDTSTNTMHDIEPQHSTHRQAE